MVIFSVVFEAPVPGMDESMGRDVGMGHPAQDSVTAEEPQVPGL